MLLKTFLSLGFRILECSQAPISDTFSLLQEKKREKKKLEEECKKIKLKKTNDREDNFSYEFLEHDILSDDQIARLVHFSTVLESYLYKIEVLNEQTIQEYILETNKLLSIIPIDIKNLCKNYEKEIELNIKKITNLILAFPIVVDESFYNLRYSVKKKIPYEQVLFLLSNCLPIKTIVDLKSITLTCKEICKIVIESTRIMKKEGAILKSTELWENILLSPIMTTSGNRIIHELFLNRDNIIKEIHSISRSIAEKNLKRDKTIEKTFCKLQDIETKEYIQNNLEQNDNLEPKIEELYFQVVDSPFDKNLVITRTKDLNYKIQELYYKIVSQHYDEYKRLSFIITEKQDNSEKFKYLINKINEKSILLSEEYQQIKNIWEKIGVYDQLNDHHYKSHNDFIFSSEKKINDLFIQTAMIEHFTVKKILILINQFSKYFEDISSQKFVGSLKKLKLNPNQLDGLASILLIAQITNNSLNEMIKEKEEAKKMHIMSNFIQKLEKNLSDPFIKKILERTETIRLVCNELNKKEEFISMLREDSRPSNAELEMIEIKASYKID